MPADDKSTSRVDSADAIDSIKCREVVQEILDFGINQKQLLILIKLLALELENNETMKEITKLANQAIEIKTTHKTTILV
jgi:hypothetical protein